MDFNNISLMIFCDVRINYIIAFSEMQTFNFYLLCCCFLLGNPASSWVRADVLKDVECSDDPDGYIIPDPVYCDR